MYPVIWLPEAREDLGRVYKFIQPHSEKAAGKALYVILEAVDRLSEFPETGRPYEPDISFRECVVSFGARGYIIRYRFVDQKVVIARIWHGLEDR